MTKNKAADRLWQKFHWSDAESNDLIVAALAEERCHVIEQIRERMNDDGGFEGENIDAILDDLSHE